MIKLEKLIGNLAAHKTMYLSCSVYNKEGNSFFFFIRLLVIELYPQFGFVYDSETFLCFISVLLKVKGI